jgi:hypothetical protein
MGGGCPQGVCPMVIVVMLGAISACLSCMYAIHLRMR